RRSRSVCRCSLSEKNTRPYGGVFLSSDHFSFVTDGRGFVPRVPFGTHALQACTIDRSVTRPLRRSAADHLKFRRSGNVAVIKVAVGGIIRRAAVEGR